MVMAWLAVSPNWCNTFSVSDFRCGSNLARTVASFAMGNPLLEFTLNVAHTGYIYKKCGLGEKLAYQHVFTF
jgi:hypothetical protein